MSNERGHYGLGVEMIAAERERQKSQEGWTAEHDDEHDDEELALAARCYACPPGWYERARGLAWSGNPPQGWPWDARWWKPSTDDRIRELTKAGALIAAEIDRLARAGEPVPGASIDGLVDAGSISVRAANACYSAGVSTLGEVAAKGVRFWQRRPSVGPVTLNELRNLLRDHGLVFLVEVT